MSPAFELYVEALIQEAALSTGWGIFYQGPPPPTEINDYQGLRDYLDWLWPDDNWGMQ